MRTACFALALVVTSVGAFSAEAPSTPRAIVSAAFDRMFNFPSVRRAEFNVFRDGRLVTRRNFDVVYQNLLVAVALFAMAFKQNGNLQPLQWAAVGLSAAAAFALNYTGGALPARTVLAMAVTVTMYAMSDLYIVELIEALGPRNFANSARAACLCYVLCGLAGAALLPHVGRGDRSDWRAALPFTLSWFGSMFLFFWCLGLSGVVLGNIVLATRGVFSIALGAMLAWRGHEHLEQKALPGVHWRRALAAGAMIGAIAMYYRAEAPP